jgi:hypothetical protein
VRNAQFGRNEVNGILPDLEAVALVEAKVGFAAGLQVGSIPFSIDATTTLPQDGGTDAAALLPGGHAERLQVPDGSAGKCLPALVSISARREMVRGPSPMSLRIWGSMRRLERRSKG